ncbi:MAG: NAD(+) diphosphatase [Betaproteobacteria bacterium]|nr:NAD(+) diphosphatase [Betaproteobacteria bacterium]
MHTPPGFAPAHRLPAVLPGTALGFAYSGTRLVVRGSVESPVIPTLAELDAAGLAGDRHYLGEIDGVPCVAIALANIEEPPPGFAMAGLRSFFFRLPDPLLAIAARAFQIADWDRSHRYCGRCGARTRDGDGERAKECPSCGLVAYPRVSPAMMALVTRGRELLLARSARFASGVYSALAGFVEPGETIEDCIRREVREEVGVEVGEPVYFASQSWAFPHSLMIAYTVEYAGGEIRLDDPEIEDARWFALDALPKLPPSVSIARRLIDATVERLRAP